MPDPLCAFVGQGGRGADRGGLGRSGGERRRRRRPFQRLGEGRGQSGRRSLRRLESIALERCLST